MTALRDFDLEATLECGQCFRWDRQPDGSYRGTAGGKALCVSQDHMEAAMDDPFWRAYFDLDRDYAAIREALSASSPVLAKAASFAPGIRILQQDRGRRFVRLSSPRTTTSPGSKGSFRGCAKPLARRWSKGSGVFHRRNVLPPGGRGPRVPALRLPRAVHTRRGAEGGFRGSRSGSPAGRSPCTGARAADGHCGRGPQGGGLRVALWPAPAGSIPNGCVDEARHEGMVPRQETEDFGPYAGIAQQYLFHYIRTAPRAGNP